MIFSFFVMLFGVISPMIDSAKSCNNAILIIFSLFNPARSEKIKKENIAMKQILKNLPDKIVKSYFEIWNEYQKNSSQESRLLHDIDKLEMAFQAKFYQNKGISKEKLQTFFNTAKKEIKSKNLRNILSNFME